MVRFLILAGTLSTCLIWSRTSGACTLAFGFDDSAPPSETAEIPLNAVIHVEAFFSEDTRGVSAEIEPAGSERRAVPFQQLGASVVGIPIGPLVPNQSIDLHLSHNAGSHAKSYSFVAGDRTDTTPPSAFDWTLSTDFVEPFGTCEFPEGYYDRATVETVSDDSGIGAHVLYEVIDGQNILRSAIVPGPFGQQLALSHFAGPSPSERCYVPGVFDFAGNETISSHVQCLTPEGNTIFDGGIRIRNPKGPLETLEPSCGCTTQSSRGGPGFLWLLLVIVIMRKVSPRA